MFRYIRRHRKYYTFWFLVGSLCFLLLYMTSYSIFNHSRTGAVDAGYEELENSRMEQLNKIIRRSPDSNEAFPDLPIRPPTHVQQKPFIVHYLWCGQRLFDFRHFLSIKSADTIIKPSKIIFHYVELPLLDKEGYFVWFNHTLQFIPDILLNKLERTTCPTSGDSRLMLILDLVLQYGGVYIPDDVIMLEFPNELRTAPFVTNVVSSGSGDYSDGIIVGKQNEFDVPGDSRKLFQRMTATSIQRRKLPNCVDQSIYEKTNSQKIICITVPRMLFPKDIWKSNSKFAIMARVLVYEKLTLQPDHDLSTPFPKIAHYICTSSCEIEFITFISILSSLYVANLERVYIHGQVEPSGQWWLRLQNDASVVFVKHDDNIFKRENIHSLSRDPCPLRVEILLHYGGVYVDGQVLWTQQIPDHYFGYSAVVSPDWHSYGSWPDSVNPSIIMGKDESTYLIKLNRILKSRTDVPNWFNDHFSAYHIIEDYTDSVFLDRRLQVKCLNHNCHPTWLLDYRSELHQNKPGNTFDWRNGTLSVHWVDSLPNLDVDMVKYLSGIQVEIARHVLQAANIDLNAL